MNRMNHLRAETHTRARGLAHGVRQTATMIVRGCALLCFRTGVQRGFDGAVVGGRCGFLSNYNRVNRPVDWRKVMQTGMNVDVFEAGSVCGSAVDASSAAWFNLSKGGGCLGRFESRRG